MPQCRLLRSLRLLLCQRSAALRLKLLLLLLQKQWCVLCAHCVAEQAIQLSDQRLEAVCTAARAQTQGGHQEWRAVCVNMQPSSSGAQAAGKSQALS